jgi:hypothetical protein
VNALGVLVDGDAYHSTIMDLGLPIDTGIMQVGSLTEPGRMVAMPALPEDVLPEFSEIAGKLWLLRVAWSGCACEAPTARCGCRAGNITQNRQFTSPPWAARYPGVKPSPPYGNRLINPWLADRVHRRLVALSERSDSGTKKLGLTLH